jgi:hypothetical protein
VFTVKNIKRNVVCNQYITVMSLIIPFRNKNYYSKFTVTLQ